MTKIFIPLFFLPFLVSCNIYSFLNKVGTSAEILEAALACESQANYTCAINFYNLLPAGVTKNGKLCGAYLSRGGTTLNTLLSIAMQNSASMLTDFATALLPWSSSKSSDMDAAADTYCLDYGNAAASGGQGALLKTLALIARCAMRVAKTEQTGGNADADTTCTTANPTPDNIISQRDIGDNTGDITTYGMCKTDVDQCGVDLGLIDSAQLRSVGLTAFANAYDAIPNAIWTGGTTMLKRQGIYNTANAP